MFHGGAGERLFFCTGYLKIDGQFQRKETESRQFAKQVVLGTILAINRAPCHNSTVCPSTKSCALWTASASLSRVITVAGPAICPA
jgi:hypothetical protein